MAIVDFSSLPPRGYECRICERRPDLRRAPVEECVVTDISLHNGHVLNERHGLPVSLTLDSSATAGCTIVARFEDPRVPLFFFSGFSWGYRGEGPCGLADYFRSLALPVPIEEIAGWPAPLGGPTVYKRGLHYPIRRQEGS